MVEGGDWGGIDPLKGRKNAPLVGPIVPGESPSPCLVFIIFLLLPC